MALYHYEVCFRNSDGEGVPLISALGSADIFPLFVYVREHLCYPIGSLFARKVFH